MVRWVPILMPFVAAGFALIAAGLSTNLVLSVFGLLILGVVGTPAVLILRGAFRERASDLVVDDRGMHFAGGRFAGRRFAWSELTDAEAISDTTDKMGTERNVRIALALRVTFTDGVALELARAFDPDEQQSLVVVRDAILHALGKGIAAPVVAPANPDVVTCTACGGVLAPSAEPAVPCPYCHAQVAMPESIRQRVTAGLAIDVARSGEGALVKKLIVQPAPTSVNARLLFATIAYLGGLPLALIGIVQAARGLWPWAVPLAALGAMLLLRATARAAVVDRVALRTMTTAFGARPPDRANAPYRCRACGAPLRDAGADERALVRCSYCNADNVLGFGIFAVAAAAGQERMELESALASRRRARGHEAMQIAVAIALFVAAAVTFALA